MGNPNRQRGVGRNAGKGWKMEQRLEVGELALPNVSAVQEKKRADVISLDTKKPIEAINIHSSPSLPDSDIGTTKSKVIHAKVEKKKPVLEKNELEHWIDEEDDGEVLNAAVEVFNRAREERLKDISTRMEKELSPPEQRFIDSMVDDYADYFFEEKRKADRKRIKVDENWVEAVRQFYIDERKRWGLKRQIASEKAELLGNYLELKLPAGFPEKKMSRYISKNEKEEKVFTPKQSSELLDWISLISRRFKEWTRESEQWGLEFGDEETRKKAIFDRMKEEVSKVINDDAKMKSLFSENEIPKAVEHVMKYVKKFNFNINK